MFLDVAARLWTWLVDRDEGQDLLEYALLAALIAIAAVGVVTEVGNTIKTVFWEAISAGAPKP